MTRRWSTTRVVAAAGLAMVLGAPDADAEVTTPDPCKLAEVTTDGLTVTIRDLGLKIDNDGSGTSLRQFDVVWDHTAAESMSMEAVVAAKLQETVPPKGSISHTYPKPGTYVLELAIATDDDPCQTFDIDAATPPTGLLYEVTLPPKAGGSSKPVAGGGQATSRTTTRAATPASGTKSDEGGLPAWVFGPVLAAAGGMGWWLRKLWRERMSKAQQREFDAATAKADAAAEAEAQRYHDDWEARQQSVADSEAKVGALEEARARAEADWLAAQSDAEAARLRGDDPAWQEAARRMGQAEEVLGRKGVEDLARRQRLGEAVFEGVKDTVGQLTGTKAVVEYAENLGERLDGVVTPYEEHQARIKALTQKYVDEGLDPGAAEVRAKAEYADPGEIRADQRDAVAGTAEAVKDAAIDTTKEQVEGKAKKWGGGKILGR